MVLYGPVLERKVVSSAKRSGRCGEEQARSFEHRESVTDLAGLSLPSYSGTPK